jgi:hypothetical protein
VKVKKFQSESKNSTHKKKIKLQKLFLKHVWKNSSKKPSNKKKKKTQHFQNSKFNKRTPEILKHWI